MRSNPIQFAVVREDPQIERLIMSDEPVRRVLLIASGGCTALSLQSWWPEAEFSLVDPNPAQLNLVQQKVGAVGELPDSSVLSSFNVGSDDGQGLCQCGNFESLFRRLRHFLHEFVATPAEIAQWFVRDVSQERMNAVFAEPYWRVAFQLHFSDEMLNTMFGAAATQHAPPGSYPDYFRKRLERGLLSSDVRSNYFLHHIFLGRYLPDALPPYLGAPAREHRFEYVEGTLDHVEDLGSYDLVNLSNIMDWMAPEDCRPMVQRLRNEMRPGAKVMWRQLNNTRDRCPWFGEGFRFDHQADSRLAVSERSLFYASIHVGTKEA